MCAVLVRRDSNSEYGAGLNAASINVSSLRDILHGTALRGECGQARIRTWIGARNLYGVPNRVSHRTASRVRFSNRDEIKVATS